MLETETSRQGRRSMSLRLVRHHLRIRNAKTPVSSTYVGSGQFDLTEKSKKKTKKQIEVKQKKGFFILAPTCASQPFPRD